MKYLYLKLTRIIIKLSSLTKLEPAIQIKVYLIITTPIFHKFSKSQNFLKEINFVLNIYKNLVKNGYP